MVMTLSALSYRFKSLWGGGCCGDTGCYRPSMASRTGPRPYQGAGLRGGILSGVVGRGEKKKGKATQGCCSVTGKAAGSPSRPLPLGRQRAVPPDGCRCGGGVWGRGRPGPPRPSRPIPPPHAAPLRTVPPPPGPPRGWRTGGAGGSPRGGGGAAPPPRFAVLSARKGFARRGERRGCRRPSRGRLGHGGGGGGAGRLGAAEGKGKGKGKEGCPPRPEEGQPSCLPSPAVGAMGNNGEREAGGRFIAGVEVWGCVCPVGASQGPVTCTPHPQHPHPPHPHPGSLLSRSRSRGTPRADASRRVCRPWFRGDGEVCGVRFVIRVGAAPGTCAEKQL